MMAQSFLPLNFLTITVLLSLFPILNSQAVEIQALLQFKSKLNDPLNHLESWNESHPPCKFLGITCDSNSGEVIGISLTRKNLSGEISPSICAIRGLSSLVLGENSISGDIPSELVNCTNLKVLNFSTNALSGQLPDLSILQNLQSLDMSSNGFSGDFPTWVSELTGLTALALAANNFSKGEIPKSIGNMKNLTYLFLAQCNLVGEIPASLFELTSLETLDLSMNLLSGEFPKEITNLWNLRKIELYQNHFTGELPSDIATLIHLREFDISRNQISGIIPPEFGNLKNLTVIQLFQNNFWGDLPKGFGDLQFLNGFSIYENNFSGEIPPNLGRFSPLNSIDISENNFSGPFPKFLCQNNNLMYLLALDNNFFGEFPDTYANCKSLLRFRISSNRFTGRLPNGIWGLPFAVIIDLSDNAFTGEISSHIGNSTSLNQLYVQNNKFSGEIPVELGALSQLQKLFASNNSFSGPIPLQIGNLFQLTSLHLEKNELTGSVPPELGTCSRLVEIDLSQNSLSGDIPGNLSLLSSLNSLNLSQNLLTGPIPEAFQWLKLSSVDFSRNQLTGLVPLGLLMIAGEEAFSGNPGLCINGNQEKQWDPELGICTANQKHKDGLGKRLLIVSIILSAMFVLLAGLVLVSYKNFRLQESHKGMDLKDGMGKESNWKIESFHPTELDAEDVFNLDEENLIGSGGTGKVYRVELKNKRTVAVKQFRKGNSEVLMAEMGILAKIRHRNILKLYACLTSGDISYLVFEYMQNGNLYQALRREIKGGHPELDWNRRYKIALGAAKGIMYLHHDCSPGIIHRDIKSTNILLDEEYEAKIADFGIAKIAEESDLSCFAGTHGYIAPELAYSSKVTEKSDVYSFGVVMLELLTACSPVEPQYGEGKDIVSWVSTHLHCQNVQEVLDPKVSAAAEDEMINVLKVAILCTSKLPSLRPTMREVVNMLIDADPCTVVTPREMFNGKNF